MTKMKRIGLLVMLAIPVLANNPASAQTNKKTIDSLQQVNLNWQQASDSSDIIHALELSIAYYEKAYLERTIVDAEGNVLDKAPRFQGGEPNTFSQWVNHNLNSVYDEKGQPLHGKVTLQFTISTTGEITKVLVLHGADPRLDKAAVRTVLQSPKWTPGTSKGKPVNVTYVFPIIFGARDEVRQ